MSTNTERTTSESFGEGDCVVCFKKVEFYSVGICDHPVCYECSTRMRVLCKQQECPICRGEMPRVIFTREVKPFAQLKPNPHLYDDKYGLAFCSHTIQEAYFKLLDLQCNKCNRSFRTFVQLKDHMRKEHELFYCELCVENLKIFAFERKCYSRASLATHRRKGDEDNKSHRGHPLCEFCDVRYMDNDELFRHLRIDHFYCHFCDTDGKHQYYSNYDQLRQHFNQEHYLCEEGDCKNEQFTSVFRSDIDLKAHVASVHSRQLGRAATKQARTLEVEFNFAPRRNQDQQNYQRGRGRRPQNHQRVQDEEEGAIGYVDSGGPIVTNIAQMDFPTLGTSSQETLQSNSNRTTSITFTSKVTPNFNGDDFPTLGGASAPRPNITMTNTTKTNNKKTENFPVLGPPKNNNNITISKSKETPKPSTSGTVKLTLNSSRQQEKPHSGRSNVSIHVNNQNGTTVTTRISTMPTPTTPSSVNNNNNSTAKRSEAFPALGASKSQTPIGDAQWVVVPKTKREPKKVAPAPILPPRPSDFPSLGPGYGGGANKKPTKKSSVTVPVEDWWTKTKDSAKSVVETTNTTTATTKTTTTSGSDSSTSKAKTTKMKKNNKDANGNINNINSNNNDGQVKNQVKKMSKLDIGPLKTPPKGGSASGGTSGGTSSGVSGLGVGVSDETTKTPPPGIKVKPPPGFNCLSSNNDLTFTSSNGRSYAIVPKDFTYVQPNNFSYRNSNLISSFISVLNDKEKLSEFKKFSDMFRNGTYSADKYYEHCECVLREKFDRVFPELLLLLPDINKQRELYAVFKERSSIVSNLEECATCKQIVSANDLKQHLNSHYMQNHFPNLQTTENNNKGWKKQ